MHYSTESKEQKYKSEFFVLENTHVWYWSDLKWMQLFKLSASSTDVSEMKQSPQSKMQTNLLSCCCRIPCSPVSNIQSCPWFPVFCIWSLHVTRVSLDRFNYYVVHCKRNSNASRVRKQQMALRKVIHISVGINCTSNFSNCLPWISAHNSKCKNSSTLSEFCNCGWQEAGRAYMTWQHIILYYLLT